MNLYNLLLDMTSWPPFTAVIMAILSDYSIYVKHVYSTVLCVTL